MTQNDFAFRIDRWTDDGERIVEHVARAEDFQIAMATYHAARKRWPKAAMTLRQDTRVIEDNGVRGLVPFFRSRGPRRAAKAAGGSERGGTMKEFTFEAKLIARCASGRLTRTPRVELFSEPIREVLKYAG